MKNLGLIIWSWASTLAMGFLIYFLTLDNNISFNTASSVDSLLKILYVMILYSVLFILFYRAIIFTLKSTVDRLSRWRSKGEKLEDAEFVLIIETLSITVSILTTILFSVFVQCVEFLTRGPMFQPDIQDILISVISILLTSIVVYSMPIVGELEVAIKNHIDKKISKLNKKNRHKITK